MSSFTAALDAPYTVWPGTGMKAPMLDTFTSAASGRRIRCGRKARTMLTTPQKFTCSTRSMSAVSSSMKGSDF